MEITKTSFSCKRGDFTIKGTEYRPTGEKLPVAVISHAFMANQGMVKHYAKLFAECGYAAFIFDFIGGCVLLGKSDGKSTEMSVLTEVEDLKSVIEYAKSLPYTDETNITLMGCSQGGFVSALTAKEYDDVVKKLILFYPALCIPHDARCGKMILAKFDPKNIPETFMCGPMKLGRCYVEAVIDMNPYEAIKGYNKDVLIVHGTADKLVDISYSEKAVEEYKKANSNRIVQFNKITDGGHIFSKAHDKIAVEHLKAFIEL